MRRLRPLPVLGLLPLLLAGCGDAGEVHAITDVRTHETVRHDVPTGLTPAERYGYRRRGAPPPGHGAQAPTHEFGWETPAGWEEKAVKPGGLRKGSWTITGEPRTDVSLVALPGSGGGLADNVNRWRGEMGLPPLDAAAVAALPMRKLLGRDAAYVELEGTWSGGQSGSGSLEDARLLGIILSLPQATLFLKLTGPEAVVAANREAFEALAASITFGAPSEPQAPSRAPGTFSWDAPEGWTEQPPKMMRIATFVPEDAPTAWCYVSRLGGTAGGRTMNVNRWRGEMGKADALDDAEVAALPTLEVLGTQATLLDLEGSFRGTGGPPQDGARMLGVICPREGDVVFVKMVGPAEAIARHYDAFVAFCTSLQETR